MICSIRYFLSFILLLAASCLVAAPPVPFSGKLAVDGKNFHGNALFAFSLVDGEGAVHWKHANEPDARIENFVMNGRYLVLLGGQGMQTLPADLFLKHDSLFLRVSVDLKDGKGLRLLEPDQRITSSPYALSAEIARLADGVTPGAITAGMIDAELLADLNRTAGITEITREMLPQDVRNDLNRTVRLQDLSPEVSQSINRSITLSDLDSQVITELNNSITPGSISLDQLSQQVRSDINATITRERLSEDLLADLNRTVRLQDLSPEVSQSINRSISLNDLDSQVITELNNSIATGSITLDLLSSQVRNDINRTITKSMLSQEVLNELNSSSGGGGVVPGSLLAVPANQSAPSGYSLYSEGEPKDLVWEEKAPVSVARYAGDGVEVLGGKIYFVGGWTDSSSSAQNIAERYDPATNTWETLANMSAARRGVACAVLNGKLYAIGGAGSSVEVFDPSTDSWSASVALPSGVKWGTATTVNGKIFLMGGKNDSGTFINQVLCFDPVTSQWSTKANMLTARDGMKLVWLENRIWAIGGFGGSATNKVESYDPATDTWRAEASLITARHWPVAWVTNGRIFVGGGLDVSGARINSIEVYGPATKQWTSTGNLPEANWAADAVVLNDKAYVVAGQTASGVYSNKVFAADLNASVSGVFDLYRKDGNASSGVPTVQAEVADGSVTASKLSSEVSSALKPVLISQPNSVVSANGGSTYLSVGAIGVGNTYQWKKNGADIAGATGSTLSITDLNASQHEGNYTVEASNPFGSTTSMVAQIDVNGSLTQGLAGWWKFDGNANDSSGNGNHGVVNGATLTTDRFGNLDSAYLFDGTSPYILISNDFGSTVSISIWISKYNEIGEMVWCFGNQGTGPDLIVTENKISLNTWDSTDNSFGNFVHERKKWYHFVTVISSDNTRQYVNGVLLGAAAYRSPSGRDFYISMKESGQGDYAWTGLLDDVRIYDRVLSGVEVKALYELGEQPVQESGSGTTTVVNGTVANGSITTDQLSEQILKYLKPEITQQPTAGTIFADTNHTLSVSAEGKYLTYQWKKNGANLSGETNSTLSITDANATQHDGNYTVVVSNDFGSVESGEVEIFIATFGPNATSTPLLWLDASELSAFNLSENNVSEWRDLSASNSHGTQSNPSNQPTYSNNSLGGNAVVTFDGVDDYLAHNSLGTTETATLFFLFRLHSISEYSSIISTDGPWQGTSGETHIIFQGTSSNYGINWATKVGSNQADMIKTSNSYNSPNTWHLVSAVMDKANFSFYSNGSDFGSGEKVDFNNNFTNFRIGSWYNLSTNDRFFDGDIAEMILYGNALDNINRQKIEGYLAHKWNLATELPSDHPYKNSAP